MSNLEQFAEETLARLEAEPWLLPWIEDDDTSLDEAEARYRAAVRAARARLNTRGVAVYERVRPRPGIQTTALAVEITEEQR
jgi:DNA-directed RNA polymerase subunit H (RpoH/RPB5)